MPSVAVLFAPLRVSPDFIDYPYFADLGAVQAAAVLRDAGHAVTLVDALAMPGAELARLDDGYFRMGAPVAAVAARVPAADAFVVAYTPFHRPPARDPLLAELLATLRARHPRTPIVLADLYQSGQHVVDVASSRILAAYGEVDAILRYEAEADLEPLVRELVAAGRPAAPFERRGAEPSPLDALPLPAWDLVDLGAHWAFHASVVRVLGRAAWAFPIEDRALPFLSSRGCPFRCAHCSSNPGRAAGAPKTQRRHSPARLDRALADLAARGARTVHVLDELANVNEAHFDALLAALARHDLRFEIPNGLRADYVEPKHLVAMKGRLTTLSVSAESGDPRVVDEIVDKQLDLDVLRATALAARDAGIPLLVHFMIGLPGESRADVNRTLACAADLHDRTGAFASVQFATPLPGTRLAELAAARGRVLPVVEDWGPHFQRSPTIATDELPLDAVARFREVYDQRIALARAPGTVVVAPTFRCNDRCTFCTLGTGEQRDGDLARIDRELVAARARGAGTVEIDGGEPTLSPALVPLIQRARRLGFDAVHVTTNGRLASHAPNAARLARSGATRILVSIHGATAASHGAIAGVPEAFVQTTAGLRELLAAAPPGVEIGVATTVARANLDELGAIADLARALGAAVWRVGPAVPLDARARAAAAPPEDAAAAIVAAAARVDGALRVEVTHVPPCLLGARADLAVPDRLAVPGALAWIGDDAPVDAWLRARRVKDERCAPCEHAVGCGGFYRDEPVRAALAVI